MRIPVSANLKDWTFSLSTKFFVYIILFIIIPVFGVFIINHFLFEAYIKKEVSQRTIENISRVEDDVNDVFDSLSRLSIFVVGDNSILGAFKDTGTSYFERAKTIDGILANIRDSLAFSDKIRITIFDNEKNIYTNWERGFLDYSEIYEKEWVKKAAGMKGHLIWSPFEPLFESDEKEKGKRYVSFARAIVDAELESSYGILIISLEEKELLNLFSKYAGDDDGCVLVTDSSNIVMSLDKAGITDSKELEQVLENIALNRTGSEIQRIGNRDYLVNTYAIKIPWSFSTGEWRITVFTYYNRIMRELNRFSSRSLMIFSIFAIIILLVAGTMTDRIVKPVKMLVKGMTRFKLDNEIPKLDTDRKDEIGHLNRAFCIMAENMQTLFRELKEEHEVKEKYRFESLKAQLNPHFLFNTLNMIRWMALIRKADNIVESIDALGNLLKFSMSKGDELVFVKEELESIKSYIFIQNSRFGGRYSIKTEIPEGLLSLKIIKFILQPIVENAVIHAFSSVEAGGEIRIRGWVEAQKLILTVEDNGKGISEEQIKNLTSRQNGKKRDEKKVTGLGIQNVIDRIRVAYGEGYGLEISGSQGKGTIVRYSLPIIREVESGNA